MIAIKNGKLITITQGIKENSDLLIENGKITAIGQNLPIPAGTEIIDASSCWVTPGFIEAHSHICMANSPNNYNQRIDLNEFSSPITPALRASDAINPRDFAIKKARSVGLTTVCALPGSTNVIAGSGICIKLKDAVCAQEMIIPGTEQFKMALGENPKRYFGDSKKAPITRMAVAALIRETLYKAKEYAAKKYDAGQNGETAPFDYQMEALIPVIEGRMRVHFHCHRSDDIVTAISLAEEFGLKYSLDHVTEGYLIADYLAGKKVDCILGPLAMEPVKVETSNISWENPAILEKAGINFGLMQDTGYNTYLLPLYVGKCIAYGLSEKAAFQAVTIHPAKLLGIDNRMGSLDIGKDADIAVFNGHPFSAMSRCLCTLIEGVIYRE